MYNLNFELGMKKKTRRVPIIYNNISTYVTHISLQVTEIQLFHIGIE